LYLLPYGSTKYASAAAPTHLLQRTQELQILIIVVAHAFLSDAHVLEILHAATHRHQIASVRAWHQTSASASSASAAACRPHLSHHRVVLRHALHGLNHILHRRLLLQTGHGVLASELAKLLDHSLHDLTNVLMTATRRRGHTCQHHASSVTPNSRPYRYSDHR